MEKKISKNGTPYWSFDPALLKTNPELFCWINVYSIENENRVVVEIYDYKWKSTRKKLSSELASILNGKNYRKVVRNSMYVRQWPHADKAFENGIYSAGRIEPTPGYYSVNYNDMFKIA